MKKIICLVMLLFLVTGCDIEYNLTIDEESFNEEVQIVLPNTSQMEAMVFRTMKTKQISFVEENPTRRHYYTLNVDTTQKDHIYMNYDYKYNINNITKSNAITQCYKNINLSNTDDYIEISTQKKFDCIYRDSALFVENATINIITPLKVVSNNADEVNGKKYTWKINKDNYENKPIKIKLEKRKKTENMDSIKLLIITLGIVVLVVGVIVLIIFIKNRRSNRL